jgi:hypothetical protein
VFSDVVVMECGDSSPLWLVSLLSVLLALSEETKAAKNRRTP